MPYSDFENPVDMLDESVITTLDDVLLVFMAAIEADFLRCNYVVSDFSF
jgi:hypothetical protein